MRVTHPDVACAHRHQLVEVGARDVGMGHAHAIAIRPQGYAVATDPRAEGAAVGL